MKFSGREDRANIWWVSSARPTNRFLATLFNIQINGLADRFLMEIEENVNPGTEKGSFQRHLLRTDKNMQFVQRRSNAAK